MEDQPHMMSTAVKPHVAVCPSAGMGHLTPSLTLASTLSSAPYDCTVTVVIVVPLITAAESDEISSFFTSNPHILRLDFHVDLASPTANVDPFFLRYDSISQSADDLAHRLSTLRPPISAAFSDFLLTRGFNDTNGFKNYTIITTSARFFPLMAYVPHLVKSPPPPGHPAEIPGLDPYPAENIPPPFFNPKNMFTSFTISNAQNLHLSKGIVVNTFDSFEPETLLAINSGRTLPGLLPPIFPVGPLLRVEVGNKNDPLMSWLDEQPENSVIYVSFGNRTAISRDQIRELGIGLERSGYGFIWVVKTSKIDKEEKADLEDILGKELNEKLCKKGKVVMRWVSQMEILEHKAVGGFVSHCGWNSVTEAARYGVPVVAWPQHGDQRENAGVVEKAGLGIWERGWGAGGKVVLAPEIEEKVKFVMGNGKLRKSATWVGEEAVKACGVGGSSMSALMSIIEELKEVKTVSEIES
ncbi:uncharacterized protein [Phyllobates terribilis]|uniref:uncharacterized protein n=1 Tax=Phyllobates terribilis TaxID=111132 RepID=UPI003CCAB569